MTEVENRIEQLEKRCAKLEYVMVNLFDGVIAYTHKLHRADLIGIMLGLSEEEFTKRRLGM